MSSIWRDLNLNPSVESCFTCVNRVSSFLCTFKLLGYQPPNDVASRLFSFALNRHLELTLQYDRICQLKALPHRVQNVFWQEWDSNPRTHSCTRILDWGMSWVWRLRPLWHPAWFTSTYFLLICVFSIEWHFQFRDVICSMVCVIYLDRFEFKPARRVVFYMSPPSILFFVHFQTARLSTTQWHCESFVFFGFGLSSWIDVPVWQNLSAEGSASSCSKQFLTGVGFELTPTLVYPNSRLRNVLSLAT